MPHSAAQTGVKKEGAVILRQRCLYLLQFSFFLSHLQRIRQFLLQYWPLLPGRPLKVSPRRARHSSTSAPRLDGL